MRETDLINIMDRLERVEKRVGFQERLESGGGSSSYMLTYSSIPMLRGFWPCSAMNTSKLAETLIGYHLTADSSPKFGYSGIIPHIYLNGSSSFYYGDNAQFDITGGSGDGADSSSIYGITMGLWIKPSGVSGTQFLMSKYNTASNQRSFYLTLNNDTLRFWLSQDGGTTNRDYHDSTATLSTDTWYFVAARWGASDMSVWIDDTRSDGPSSITGIYNSSANFALGRGYDVTTQYYFTGYMAHAWISACYLSNDWVSQIYTNTKSVFGK